jgi:hypothetical protein
MSLAEEYKKERFKMILFGISMIPMIPILMFMAYFNSELGTEIYSRIENISEKFKELEKQYFESLKLSK